MSISRAKGLISGVHPDSAYLFFMHASQVLLVASNDKDEV